MIEHSVEQSRLLEGFSTGANTRRSTLDSVSEASGPGPSHSGHAGSAVPALRSRLGSESGAAAGAGSEAAGAPPRGSQSARASGNSHAAGRGPGEASPRVPSTTPRGHDTVHLLPLGLVAGKLGGAGSWQRGGEEEEEEAWPCLTHRITEGDEEGLEGSPLNRSLRQQAAASASGTGAAVPAGAAQWALAPVAHAAPAEVSTAGSEEGDEGEWEEWGEQLGGEALAVHRGAHRLGAGPGLRGGRGGHRRVASSANISSVHQAHAQGGGAPGEAGQQRPSLAGAHSSLALPRSASFSASASAPAHDAVPVLRQPNSLHEVAARMRMRSSARVGGAAHPNLLAVADADGPGGPAGGGGAASRRRTKGGRPAQLLGGLHKRLAKRGNQVLPLGEPSPRAQPPSLLPPPPQQQPALGAARMSGGSGGSEGLLPRRHSAQQAPGAAAAGAAPPGPPHVPATLAPPTWHVQQGASQADEEADTCPVCLDASPVIALLTCKHALCVGCARDLCKRHNVAPALCPYCRIVISGFCAILPPAE